MAANSNIQWTRHTFNPHRGCCKVSEGCRNCYAETLSKRNPKVLGVWGPTGTRAPASEEYWLQPEAWNRAAQAAGERHRVFCASLADVFEGSLTCRDADAYAVVTASRARLFPLIEATPYLDWQLLTKRLENIMEMVPDSWRERFPANVWIGTSVENQQAADERIPHLLQVPARVRFLSCEPLIGPVDLRHVQHDQTVEFDALTGDHGVYRPLQGRSENRIHWVIVGGESGPGARPMHPDWARGLLAQCQAAGTAFFFKQWGEWLHESQLSDAQRDAITDSQLAEATRWKDGQGYKSAVLEAAGYPQNGDSFSFRVGKKTAGRLLDGVEWSEFPDGGAA